MSTPRTAVPVPFPVPRGINRRDALLALPNYDSPWMLNVDCETQFDRVRNGFVIHSTVMTEANGYVLGLGVFGTRGHTTHKLFAYFQDGIAGINKVFDITTSTESLAFSCADDTADEAYPLRFNARLMFHGEADFLDCDAIYDGSSWAASGFTYSASPIGGRVATSYKGRPYIASGTYLYYPTTVGAVTGALSRVDLASVFDSAGAIAWMSVLSAPGNRPTEAYLCIGNQAGEILIYGGDYPASSTWSLVSKFQTSPPVGFDSIIPYQNDTWILTQSGVVSLRDLFGAGNEAAVNLNVSDEIDDYWGKLLKQASSLFYLVARGISGCYWPEKNKIFILVPGHIDVNGTYSADIATMFVYNCTTKKWSLYSLSGVETDHLGGMTYFNDGIYFFSRNVVMTLSQTVFKDETYNSAGSYSAYGYALHSAYISIDEVAKGKRVVGFEPICKTDFSKGNLGVKAATDAGRRVSAATYPALQDGYNAPYCSVGAEGSYFQYRLEGEVDTDSTDGLEIYAVTAILEPGGLR